MTQKRNKSGWTLVEIAIVVAIIGVVLSLSVPNVVGIVNRSRVKAAESDLQIIAAAITQLMRDTGKLPGGQPLGTPGSPEYPINDPRCGLATNYNNIFGTRWKGPYLDRIPLDPWSTQYWYDPDYNGSPQGVITVVVSLGPNRKGGSGVVNPTYDNAGGLNHEADNVYVRILER